MDLSPVLTGFSVAFEPENLLFCLLGVTIGMLIGVLPGLGPAATIAILLPITYNLEPAAAVIMLAGIFYGAQYGGTITSVLLKLPGEASTVVTAIDGHALAKRGEAGSALGVAALASFIGGTASILLLSFIAPALAGVALAFGPAEYTVLALIGIFLVGTLGSGSLVKSAAAAAAGLLLATVGLDPLLGTPRFTFGTDQLADGIDFVIVAMGLFGIGEILYNLEHRDRPQSAVPAFGRAIPSRAQWLRSRLAILRGSAVGFVLGILPGGGATMSSLVAYAVEKRSAKDPSRFGKGAIEGVAGPESANNAAATSSFIPLLTLGIPANATMAVLFGALMLQGITPGPALMTEHPDVFWGVVNSMYLGNLLLLALSIPLIGVFVRMLKIRPGVLAPITIVITMLGVYSIRNNAFDMLLAVALGLVGYAMRKLGFEPGPFVLAFVLGSLLEGSFRRSMRIFGGDVTEFVQRPLSATLVGVLVLTVVVIPVLRAVRARQIDRATEPAES
ncbi:tripartite tricarboxylate transporter permease [Glycomyces harbinensis]|uniref:Putative tricarboxylic transport membrane protein n=1 Tax=Glycomyces harbinensis TaxID=58114 RepID=A0A1G6XD41_9ACTN|nr:tripartite tricarboxylate transporter permease [Glycomyces harbinensis]SDD76070.1 putative tricarboxylic transport membrane protein [Glycomyces harbinensis]